MRKLCLRLSNPAKAANPLRPLSRIGFLAKFIFRYVLNNVQIRIYIYTYRVYIYLYIYICRLDLSIDIDRKVEPLRNDQQHRGSNVPVVFHNFGDRPITDGCHHPTGFPAPNENTNIKIHTVAVNQALAIEIAPRNTSM